MIKLSSEPQRLTSTFRAYRNDIDIYTEDNEKDKEFYKVLFNRLISDKITINDVTPLGSKSDVIRRCSEEPENGRKKLFIVDGDVNIIHKVNIPVLENLYVLEGYCIENFLIDRDCILSYIYMNCGVLSKEQINEGLDYERWLMDHSGFIDLFIHFGLVDFFGGKFKIYNANKFYTKNGHNYQYNQDLVDTEIENLKAEILLLTSEKEYNVKLAELKNIWGHTIDNLFTIVSGKDYLIPIILFRTKKFKKSKSYPTLEEIKISLVHYSGLSRLGGLKSRIENL